MSKKKELAKKTKKAEVISHGEEQVPAEPSSTATKVKAEIVEKKKSTPSSLPALSDGLSHYLKEINKYPLLTKEQEME